MRVIRAVVHDCSIAKRLLLQSGGADVLVQGLQHHRTDEFLLRMALETIDDIQELISLPTTEQQMQETEEIIKALLHAKADTTFLLVVDVL